MKLLPFGRASFMLDLVSVAMVFVLPVLTWSLYNARVRRSYRLHKRIQVSTGVALLLVVIAFEIEVRMNGWRHLATASPYYDTWLFPFLYFHLFCAISTTLLWIYTLVSALKRMPTPTPTPQRAGNHRRIGWIAAGFMYTTAFTGWTFYWMAFVAV
jgi:uncharacterized membrane protein YozB (DUF420 family)